ncbi:MAG: methyltransferase domain-containing protein [Gammaproteobacteria bacterium]|nr:methyltransferase domain-containing protein [Gammaproteobacteria bacterium]MDH5660364.1 methyltransferase domain-containing protein [Gammaproteobacteria bacterium]
MLNTEIPWNLVAEGYAETTSKMFEGYAKAAINLTKIHSGSHVLDVACGPGTLPMLIHKRCQTVKAIDFADQMVSIFMNAIRNASIDNVDVICGDAQNLPYEDESFDIAFSMFGLMFFPDRSKGYSEIYRTLKPGGEVVISSWAPVVESPAMKIMFGAVRCLNPEIPEPQTVINSLENDSYFKKELEQAGFRNVVIHRITEEYYIDSIARLWEELVKGSAPVAMMKKNMPPEVWKEKEGIALKFIKNSLPELPVSLTSDAWLGYGVK